jgi:hypothetical protein
MRISEERMAALADYLQRLVDQGMEERDALAQSWEQSKSDYENKPYPYVSQFIQGWQDLPFPFAFSRAEALSDYTVTGIVTQSPMVTCLLWGSEGDSQDGEISTQEARERTMDTALRRAKIEERLKTVSAASWWANAGILRLSAGDSYSPLKIDAISPEDFVIVGGGAYSIRDSIMVGHRFQRSRGDIRRLILAKTYADVDVAALPANSEAATNSAGADTDLVDLWQIYPYLDPSSWDESDDAPKVSKREQRFSVVFEPETGSILFIEGYDYETPCYFAFGYRAAPERGFWHPRPLGAEMQGPHRAYQCMSNLALVGTAMSAAPPLAAQKGAFSRDQRYGPGQFVDMESGDLAVPAIRFDINAVQSELARIERNGDAVARINSAGIGQESQQSKTATQSAAESAGMRAGIGGFLETFSGPLAEMCEHAEEILARTFQVWKPVFQEQMPVRSAEEFMTPAKWDVPGKIPNLNPQNVLQNVQLLMGIIEKVFGLMQVGGPMVLDWGIALLSAAMNAMDFPNAEAMLKPLEGMRDQSQQPEEPAQMGGGLDGDQGMAAVLAALGAAGGSPDGPMPEAVPY